MDPRHDLKDCIASEPPALPNNLESGQSTTPPQPPPLPPQKPLEKSSIALKVREAPPGWAFEGRVEDFNYDPLTPPVGLYFFYGTLQDPGILGETLDLPMPLYPAVVNEPLTVVRGSVFEITTKDHAAKLAAYETSNYWPAPCYNSTLENGQKSQLDGYVFKYCGNPNDLSDGEFDLNHWLHLMGRKPKKDDSTKT